MSEEKIEVQEQNYGPGNVLRAKREEYEWSIEAVAEALHLSTHSVKAIEGDRYDELPGATYVIGYWRSYARLLGIDIEETIEVNKRNLNIVTSEAAGLDVNRAFKRQAKGGGFGWLLVLLVLAGAGYYAWTQNFWGLLDGSDPVQQGADMETEQAIDPAAVVEQPAADKQPQVLMPLEEKPATEVEAVELEVAVKDTAPGEPVEQAASGLIEQGSGSTPQVGTSQLSAQPGLVMSSGLNQSAPQVNKQESPNLLSVQNAPVAAPSPEQPEMAASNENVVSEAAVADTTNMAGDASTMILTLSKDSWLDVRDKTNKRLLYKTEVAGETVKVSGTPPFYVYIGTPDGVKIQYQGKNVPFETHKSGLFARFKLGEEILESL